MLAIAGPGQEETANSALEHGVEQLLLRDSQGHYLSPLPKLAHRIVEQRRRLARVHALDKRHQALLGAASEGVLGTDGTGTVTFVNPSFANLIGSKRNELVGNNVCSFLGPNIEDWTSTDIYRRCSLGDSYRCDEYPLRRRDGSVATVSFTVAPVLSAERQLEGTIFVFTDISDRKEAEAELILRSHYDSLTGLANRTLFTDSLRRSIARARRRRSKTGILFLDIDHFKLINDTYGHEGGDSLLRAASERLRKIVRASDLLARFGGDEFAILLEDVQSSDAAIIVAEKVLRDVAFPFDLGGDEVFVTASVGIALYPDAGTDIQTLLKSADIAMYGAKEGGRNGYRTFSEESGHKIAHSLTLERDLSMALRRNEFRIFYQPQVDIQSGRIIGFEALLRWKHPTHGYLQPEAFLTTLEQSGLIHDVGGWVLNTALKQLAEWHQQLELEDLRVAVNISVRQLMQQSLCDQVAQALADSGVAADHLELEVSESIFLDESRRGCIDVLRKLRDMGVRISIDDFGLGYSSLRYLRDLPVETIKIAGAFVRELTADERDTAVVRAIVDLARRLDLRVSAEHVETPEQFSSLLTHECDVAQGYLISKPMASADASRFLQEREHPQAIDSEEQP